MKIDNPLLHKIGGLLGAATVRWWMGTLDYQVAYYDRGIDPALAECRPGQRIYIFWHEYIPFPLYLRGHCNLAMLLSRHRDAEILSHIAYHMGFSFVRGSSNRGGAAALRELLAKSRTMHLTITPDGPRGPRRKLAPGCVYLASKLGLPIIAMGWGYDRPWRVRNAWDQFAIPRPFSRARAIPSGEIFVPPDLDRAGLEHYRRKIERLLNRLTDEAEAWAATGTRRQDQDRLFRGPHPLRSLAAARQEGPAEGPPRLLINADACGCRAAGEEAAGDEADDGVAGDTWTRSAKIA